MYKLIIFDFDGTLVDSAPGIVDVMHQVVDEYLLSKQILEKWQPLVGIPLMAQMEVIFPDKGIDYHETVANRYRAIYDTKAIEICPLFPNLLQILKKLQDSKIDLAIVSSKRRNLVELVLDHHDLGQYFRVVMGQQDVQNHKPHPEPVHHTLKKLNHAHKNSVVIGDSTYDLDMARNAGVDAIGVTTGIHTREILQGSKPTHIVDALDEILPLILKNGNGNGNGNGKNGNGNGNGNGHNGRH